jgi:glycosyltransferase involved in cell wall biosynthesis
MRVLLVGPALHGGEGVYMDLLRTFPPDDVSYISPGGAHTGAPGAPCSVLWEVALNRIVHPRTIPDIGFRALRLRDKFDLVHAHAHPVRLAGVDETPVVMSEGSSSAVYLADYLGWDAIRLEKAFRRTRRIYRVLGLHDRLLALDRVARVYVFSEWAREVNVRWGADARKLDVVSPGFPVPAEVDRSGRETFSFLFVGTDFERKGGFDVIEAFETVSDAYPEARLVLAGATLSERDPDRLIHGWVNEARRRRVLAKLEPLVAKGLVEDHGPVSSQRVQDLYPAADAFVMPTLAEGFGFTNVEAMSYGLPVISSSFGPIPEIVHHQQTGLLMSPGDVDGLAGAMTQLLADRDLAKRMGAAGREVFLERYTLERFRANLSGVYARALRA